MCIQHMRGAWTFETVLLQGPAGRDQARVMDRSVTPVAWRASTTQSTAAKFQNWKPFEKCRSFLVSPSRMASPTKSPKGWPSAVGFAMATGAASAGVDSDITVSAAELMAISDLRTV